MAESLCQLKKKGGGESIKTPQVILGSNNNLALSTGDTSAALAIGDNFTFYVSVGSKTSLVHNVSGQTAGTGGTRILKIKADGTVDTEIMYIGNAVDVSGYAIIMGWNANTNYTNKTNTITLS